MITTEDSHGDEVATHGDEVATHGDACVDEVATPSQHDDEAADPEVIDASALISPDDIEHYSKSGVFCFRMKKAVSCCCCSSGTIQN